jgi:hypothetical protein
MALEGVDVDLRYVGHAQSFGFGVEWRSA